jgi:NADH:ubiquinone oxidoreductase subunit 5 (subunit L)/multisubunit Na+/H+ antiporter MnhA subunit
MPFTSSSLIVSNFALCGMPFLAGFYSRDFILEMFSMRYVNMFGYFDRAKVGAKVLDEIDTSIITVENWLRLHKTDQQADRCKPDVYGCIWGCLVIIAS